MKATNVEKKLDNKEIKAIMADEKISKSEKIRKLFLGGMDVKEIAEVLNIRYNFAYNVLSNLINMNDIPVEKTEKVSKREDIIALLKEGKTLAEVSRATKTNYNYIWKISKEMKMEAEKDAAKSEVKEAAAQ
jgi:DNA-binding CsgD family transcriptional regulator